MSWLSRILKPQIQTAFSADGGALPSDSLWLQCPSCSQGQYHRELKQNLNVCPNCQHHLHWPLLERLAHLFDGQVFERLKAIEPADDPLKFKDAKRYVDRLRANRQKTGERDAALAVSGRVRGLPLSVFALSFTFMGGSVGSAVGNIFAAAVQNAIQHRRPLLAITASGGARMQEGLLSLMQLPKTVAALELLQAAKLPYLVLLTNPTTGGVSASFAMLGDIHIAEPGATIGFAGRRVIEQTVNETLPADFQTAEYLQEHGMIDMVVPRAEIPETVATLLRFFTKPA